MKTVVFGSTGFIGSHVVEQLSLAGHEVTAVIRKNSNANFLKSLDVKVVTIDFLNEEEMEQVINGHDVVYNCIADQQYDPQLKIYEQEEFRLTRILIELSGRHHVSRFVHLSSIIVYDFRSSDPIDETYDTVPEDLASKLKLEKDKYVEEVGKKLGLASYILRPASTIGHRDKKSFFSRLFTAHMNNQFPMAGDGEAKVSLVDTRDIGRAMVFLGTKPGQEKDNGLYLLKGFDTTWSQLKKEIDRVTGRRANTVEIPVGDSSFASKSLSLNRIWNDQKIRDAGFKTLYGLTESVENSINDLLLKNK